MTTASNIGALPNCSRLFNLAYKNDIDMQASELIGYAAAALTTASFVPQAIHTFRTRDVRGISLGMYSAFVAGIALWLAYGLLTSAWPVVAANAVTLALSAAILFMKLRFDGLHPTHPPHSEDQQPPRTS